MSLSPHEEALFEELVAGELSLEQANVMMEALRHSSQRDREFEAKKHRYMQFTEEIQPVKTAAKETETKR